MEPFPPLSNANQRDDAKSAKQRIQRLVDAACGRNTCDELSRIFNSYPIVRRALTDMPQNAENALAVVGINPNAHQFVPPRNVNNKWPVERDATLTLRNLVAMPPKGAYQSRVACDKTPTSTNYRIAQMVNDNNNDTAGAPESSDVTSFRLPAGSAIMVQHFNTNEEMYAEMKEIMKKTEIASQSGMSYNPNRNPSGNGRPNFSGSHMYDDDPDYSSYLMPMSHEPFSSTQNMFMNDFHNGFVPQGTFNQRGSGFQFNANAQPFVPRSQQGEPLNHQPFNFMNQSPEMSNMGIPHIGQHNGMMGQADFGGPSNNMSTFGMPNRESNGFPNRGVIPNAPMQRRNIYGPQYSQATLDTYPMYSQGPDPMRTGNGFHDSNMFTGHSLPGTGPFSNDPAQLQQQMEAAGLAVRPHQNLNFSDTLMERISVSPMDMSFREIAVGLEQISQTDLPETQYSDWDVAIKKCTQKMADKCRYEYPQCVTGVCSVLAQMIFEAMQLKPSAVKRLAELYANLVINVNSFAERLASELASNLHPNPRNLSGITNALNFVTFVYLKLVNYQVCPLEVAMRIIDFFSSLVELRPITDEHLLPVVSVLKTVGSFLDQHEAVKKRMNVVLTSVLGYAVGCQQTVSASARAEVQEIVRIREDGWTSSKYHDYQRSLIGGDALLTDDEQRWVDKEIARSTPDVSDVYDEEILDDFEEFLDASARNTARGVANSCLEEFDDLKISSTPKPAVSSEPKEE